MRLFKRADTNISAIPEDLQPYYSTQKNGWRRWLSPVLRVVLLFVVLALLIWGGVWLVRHFTTDDASKNSSQTSTQNLPDSSTKKQNSSSANAKKQSSSASSTPSATSTTRQPATPTPTPTVPTTSTPAPAPTPSPASIPSSAPTTPTPPPTPSTASLVDTGPGETVALFAVFVLAGAFGHRMFTLRKISK